MELASSDAMAAWFALPVLHGFSFLFSLFVFLVLKRHCEPVRTLAWQSRGSSESLYRGGRRCPPDLRPHSFLSLSKKERKESPRRQKKPAPFCFRRGGENSISAAFFFLSESRPLRWVAFRLILEKKENIQNQKCVPCRHHVTAQLPSLDCPHQVTLRSPTTRRTPS